MSFTNLGWVVLHNEEIVSPYFDSYEEARNALREIVKAPKPYKFALGKRSFHVIPKNWKSLTIAERYSLGAGFGRFHTYKFSRATLDPSFLDDPRNRKKNGLTIWVYSYSYSDDTRDEHVFMKDNFIGTIEDWKSYKAASWDAWGSVYSDVTKRHASNKEIIEMYDELDGDDVL